MSDEVRPFVALGLLSLGFFGVYTIYMQGRRVSYTKKGVVTGVRG